MAIFGNFLAAGGPSYGTRPFLRVDHQPTRYHSDAPVHASVGLHDHPGTAGRPLERLLLTTSRPSIRLPIHGHDHIWQYMAIYRLSSGPPALLSRCQSPLGPWMAVCGHDHVLVDGWMAERWPIKDAPEACQRCQGDLGDLQRRVRVHRSGSESVGGRLSGTVGCCNSVPRRPKNPQI